jgi:hypothetical protein
MINIPIFQNVSSRFTQRILLDEKYYQIYISWNAREESFYMNLIDDETQENIILGLKLVPSYFLLQQYSTIKNPPGYFILIDIQDKPQTSLVTFDNLGTRYYLVYITESEIQGLNS